MTDMSSDNSCCGAFFSLKKPRELIQGSEANPPS